MKRILLTAAGFENKAIERFFLDWLGKPAKDARVVWIPTAAYTPNEAAARDAQAVLPKCFEDLTNAGIPSENITTFNLDRDITQEELDSFDAIYVCGGDTRYLTNRMVESGFGDMLKEYIAKGGIYIGVSAGSVMMTSDFTPEFGYISCPLSVHCEKGLFSDARINLTNDQALAVTDEGIALIE